MPDYATDGLSGDLAHRFPLPVNGSHIGPLSRFNVGVTEVKRDVLVLISGPEPQRTRFEKMVLDQLKKFEGTAMAVLGTPEKQIDQVNSNAHSIVSHLPAKELEQEIANSELIISRSGYSTIMDLSVLGKKACFIATPGQTEQEYLAIKFEQEKKHQMMKQRSFNLVKAWSSKNEYTGFKPKNSEGYRSAIDEFTSYAFLSVNEKVVPELVPICVRTLMVCWWASIMCFTIDSPSPVPPALRSLAASTR